MSSNVGFELREYFQQNPQDFDKKITLWLTASDDFDQYLKGRFNVEVLEKDRDLMTTNCNGLIFYQKIELQI